MQLKGNFKNPDELESDEFDELLADEEEMEQQASDIEVDSDSDVVWCDDDENGENGNGDGNSSDSESIDASEDDDESVSMFSSSDEEDIAEVKPKPGKRTQGTQTQDDNETPCSSTSVNTGKAKAKENAAAGASASAAANDGNETGGGVFDYNVDEEEDETIRAMIAAIKKPRSVPPPIDMEDFISNICFHITEDIVAVGTITGDVALYRYANEGNTLLRNIEVHAKAVRDIQFTMDGRDMLTCSKDKCIMVTDMETEKLKRFYETAHDDAINKLYVVDESIFATGDDDGIVKLWDLRCKDPIFSLREVEDYISQILTNESRKLLLLTSGDGYLTTINIGARKLYVQSEPYEEELTCMGVYRGESKLVAGTSKGRLYTFNWGQFGYHCDMYPGIKTPISHMIPITDRICCVAGEEGIIRAVHIAPYKNLGVVGQHNMPIEAMDVNWSGEIIASSSHNNDVRFWNVKYFEDFGEVKYNEKHNNYKDRRHNLPSSRVKNASDFFADLNNTANDDE